MGSNPALSIFHLAFYKRAHFRASQVFGIIIVFVHRSTKIIEVEPEILDSCSNIIMPKDGGNLFDRYALDLAVEGVTRGAGPTISNSLLRTFFRRSE
jgi:hypothetical protein